VQTIRVETAGNGPVTLADACRRPQFGPDDLRAAIASAPGAGRFDDAVIFTVHTDLRYEAYLARSRAEIRRHAEIEHKPIPAAVDYRLMTNLRAEAREALDRFRPATMGQASRLEGITPADLTLLSVLLKGYSGRGSGRGDRSGNGGGGRPATPVGDGQPRRSVPS
jgi:tRNA uridine 5-carboxymethylaminomethyl modification enzyme